jgi:hypothetical protein
LVSKIFRPNPLTINQTGFLTLTQWLFGGFKEKYVPRILWPEGKTLCLNP